MTGIEPLVAPAIAKAAGAGAAKAASVGVGLLLNAKRRSKVRSLLGDGTLERELNALEALDPEQVSQVIDFCDSKDVERLAVTLSQAYLLEGNGRKAGALVDAVRAELRELVKIFLGGADSDLIADALFSGLAEAVLENVKRLHSIEKVSPQLHAELVKLVGSLAAASLRNAELLRELGNLDEINSFVDEIRAQISAMRGSMRLPHAGTSRMVPYADLYVQPRLTAPRERGIEGAVIINEPIFPDDSNNGVTLASIIDRHPRLVILGDPGGGKSTLAEKYVYDVASSGQEPAQVPFLVVLRDYAKTLNGESSKQTIVEYLVEACKLPYNVVAPANAVEYLLLNGRGVVVFDGLDELLDTSLRREVVQIVEGFAHKYPACPILVTSRRVGYSEAPLDSDLFKAVRLGDFTEANVRSYAKKWFSLDESVPIERRHTLTRAFMEDSEFVPDLRANPLLLSLMCGIYASENYIPTNRPDVYEKCSLLLFERWDKQRGIKPDLPFDAHVQAAMRSLALYMYQHQGEEGISRSRLISRMKEYLLERRFDDEESAENAAVDFIEFCKGRAWVLTDIGADTYGFTHRTFLEYFAASQLVRLNPSAVSLLSALREHIEEGSWDVVGQLALQIIGRNVEDAADEFIALLMNDVIEADDLSGPELNLLMFVIRSLEFVVPKPALLENICQCAVAHMVANADTSLVEMFTQVAVENQPRVGKVLRALIENYFGADEKSDELAALAFFVMGQRGLPRRGQYWLEWTLENLKNYVHFAKLKGKDIWWLAVMLWERGLVSLEFVLRQHGLGALYRHDYGQRLVVPPFAYRMITGKSFSKKGLIAGVIGTIGEERVGDLRVDLYRNLRAISKKKLRYRRMHLELAGNFFGFGDHREGELDDSACNLILALPIIEIVTSGKLDMDAMIGDTETSLLRIVTLVRAGKSGLDEIPPMIGECLEGYPIAQQIFVEWLAGNISFVSGIRGKKGASDAVSSEEMVVS